MSPIRREKDFQRTEIDDWDEWVEEQIQEHEASGAFDDLPHAGKPIYIHRTDVNPDYDLAFSRMKNAGIMPAWMELDREVSCLTQELDDFLKRSAVWLEAQREEILRSRATRAEDVATPERPVRPWWHFWQRLLDLFRPDPHQRETPPGPQSVGELLTIRDHMRRQYLERADELDRKTQSYHNSLPEALAHLQRLRMTPDRAERRFDARLPVRALFVDTPTMERKDS